jgi:hypothetical protein
VLVEFESGECPYLSPLDDDVLGLPEIGIEILKEPL